MGSEQVELLVFSGGRKVDGPLPRPVRILPNGEAGVVYGGQVYPLYAGNRIDVSDESFDKYECTTFVAPGRAIPFARQTSRRTTQVAGKPTGLLDDDDWYLETNRFGHYLVFDADEGSAERIVDALDRSPLGVRRWDASHRAADNGRFYDWFVRLLFEGDHDECLRQVRSLLGRGAAGTSPLSMQLDDAIPDHLRSAVVEALQKALVVARENDRLIKDLSELTTRHSTLQFEHEEARLQLESSRIEYEATIRAQQAQIASLEEVERSRRKREERALQQLSETHAEEVAQLRAQLAATESARPSTEEQTLIDLRTQLATKHSETEQLIDEWMRSEERVSDLTNTLNATAAERERLATETVRLRDRLQAKESQLWEVLNESRERRTAERERTSSRIRPNLERFFAKLFKRCDLDSESIEELFKFDRPGKAIKELMRIDDNDPHLRSVAKPVKGYEHWWELSKVHTGASGKSAMGRIYYRPHADGVVTVVHLKKDDDEQRRFLARRLTGA